MFERYGSDVTRLYTLFKAPAEQVLNWDEESIVGFVRWSKRLLQLCDELKRRSYRSDVIYSYEEAARYKASVRNITTLMLTSPPHLNTAIAQLMTWTNDISDYLEKATNQGDIGCCIYSSFKALIIMLAPMAPCLSEELWYKFSDQNTSIHQQPWPLETNLDCLPHVKETKIGEIDNSQMIVVQIDGKLRGQLRVPLSWSNQSDIQVIARDEANEAWNLLKTSQQIRAHLERHQVLRTIWRPKRRLMNLVTEEKKSK